MSSTPSDARMSALEEAMVDLARAQTGTEASITRLSEEMGAFKDEMATFKDEMRASTKEADRRWGELSNKMGTLVEDIIYPSIPTIFKKAFAQTRDPECSIRVRCHHKADPSRMREFGAVASGDDIFLINETRSRLTPAAIPAFIEVLREAKEFLPEAEGKKVMGAMATFHVDPSLVRNGERQGLLMLGHGSGLMEILNSPDFEPREF